MSGKLNTDIGEIERLRTDIDAFWTALERSWEIEPRSYFEKEAPENGFGSPLAMAVHYMWKRDTNTVEVRANAIKEAKDAVRPVLIAHYDHCTNSVNAGQFAYKVDTALQSLLDKKEGEDDHDNAAS